MDLDKNFLSGDNKLARNGRRKNKYHIRTNIGEELNLVNWQITTQSPSLNLANIFFYSISIVTLVTFE